MTKFFVIPKSVKRGIRYTCYTLDYFRYRSRYTYPIIYIACCPKTASTWLAQLLAEVLPGFHFYYPKVHSYGQVGDNYDVTDNVVRELRWKLATVRSHTPAISTNIAAMNSAFGRYLLLIRDMRDVIVSVYYHIQRYPRSAFVDHGRQRKLPWIPVSADVVSLDKEACLDVLIEQLLPDLVALSQGYLDYQEAHDNALLLRYEDVTQNTHYEVKRILDFYNLNVPDSVIKSAIDKLTPTSQLKGRYHFRKGKMGNWRNELTPYQQIRCEEIARQFLERAGYQLMHG